MKIIVRIQGGTGNQLFQYAFGRGTASFLSKKLGKSVELLIDKTTLDDARWDPHKIHRKYSLGLFHTKITFAKDSDFFGFVWIRKHYKIFDRFYNFLRLKRFFLPFYYPEQTFTFDKNVFERTKNTYFDGDWTTGKYFEHIADEIRNEIRPINPLSEPHQKILEEIRKTNAVSLHVRRGDYTTDPLAITYHGVCSPEYYKKAIAYIEEHVPSPHFFIFSDDYEWSKENFKFINHPVTCVKGSEGKDYEDMELVRECKHNIIANSTFGWWGAWLNPKKDKIMIGPKKWFANAPKGDTKDLLTDEWIKL
ncbi:MAG TPA: alpha-1,2-fucosyltransferase [Candidatus Paceibacterota bacterium]